MASIERADVEEAFQEVVASDVIKYAAETSSALQAFPPLRMGTATHRMPVVSALPTGGFLTADQDVNPSSKMTWDGVLLTAEEVALIVPVSDTAIADANFDVTAAVTTAMGEEFARILDAAVFFGTGAPASWPASGLVGTAVTATQTVEAGGASQTVADDLNNLFGEVEEFTDVTDVFAARSLRVSLRGLKDGNGAPIYVPTMGEANVAGIYGVQTRYPLGWDSAEAIALAVDRAGVKLAMRQDITFKLLDQATITGFGNLAEKDSIAFRAVMRVACAHANPVTIRAGARKYPFAAYIPDQTP
jgi:HK97 family phage major capsid protein